MPTNSIDSTNTKCERDINFMILTKRRDFCGKVWYTVLVRRGQDNPFSFPAKGADIHEIHYH